MFWNVAFGVVIVGIVVSGGDLGMAFGAATVGFDTG